MKHKKTGRCSNIFRRFQHYAHVTLKNKIMNKKVNSLLSPFLGQTNNIFLIGMRVSMLLLCIGLTGVYAHTTNAQTIDIDLEDVPITTFFREIQQKSDFVIIYRDEVIAGAKKVTIRASSATLEKILTDVLAPLGLGYEIINRQIIINKNGPSKDDTGANIIKAALQRTVNGTVTDSKGVPLPGANIIEKGTTNGVTADFDGNFSLNLADENATLVVSYIGFATKEVDVNGQTTLDVSLKESAAGLDEVIVVAYGSSDKRSFTGAAETVNSEALTRSSTASFETALQGKVSGINVSTSGQPGGKSNVQIRGIGSISGNTQPLYVLDGVVINTNSNLRAGDDMVGSTGYNPLSTINSEDIKSITVLKDAAASSLYGCLLYTSDAADDLLCV